MKRLIPALFGLVLLISCVTNPVTGENQFSLVDESWEIRTGSSLFPIYTQESFGVYPDRGVQDYVQSVGMNIARETHRPSLPYEFNLVNSSDVNAYALPGGKISITRNLMKLLESEAQLAGILGHEAAHVNLRHSAIGFSRQILVQSILMGAMIYMENEEVKGREYYQVAGVLGSNLVLLHYSRKQEMEADALGMDYLVKAGYDPEGMIQIQEILQSLQGKGVSKFMNIFQTHPLSEERMSAVRRLIRDKYTGRGEVGRERFRSAMDGFFRNQAPYEWFDRGILALHESRLDEAMKNLGEARDKLPSHAITHAMAGLAFSMKNDHRKAFQNGTRAASLDPDLFYSRYVAGLSALELKKYRDAETHLLASDRIYPERPDVRYYLGVCYEEMGNRNEAARWYRFVVDHGTGELQAMARRRLEAMTRS